LCFRQLWYVFRVVVSSPITLFVDLNFEQVTGSLWRLSEFCHTVIAGQPALLQLHDVQKWAQDALARLLPRLEAVLVANKKLVKTQVELASIVALITIAAKIAFASTSALSEDTITVFSKLLNVLLGAHMSRPVDVSLNRLVPLFRYNNN